MNFKMISSAKYSLLLTCTFVALGCCMLIPGKCRANDSKQEAFLDAQMLVDGWEASYCHIDSLKVSGTRILMDEKGHNPLNRRQIPYYHHERIQDGTKFLVRVAATPQGFDDSADYRANSFDGSIGKEYVNDPDSPLRSTGSVYRGLNNRSIEKDNILADFLQTMPNLFPDPPSGEDEPWKVKLSQQYPLGIPFFLEKYNKALAVGEVNVRPHMETVAGEACHVLELDLRSRIETFWLAHEKGMLPMKTMYVLSPDRVTRKIITKEVKEITSVSTETGILWYPRVIMENSERGTDYSYVIKVIIDEFVPHYKAPPETFSYVFPNGTLVYDKIKDLRYKIGPGELETEMNPVELDILESDPVVNETMLVSQEKDDESEGHEDGSSHVAQIQTVQTSNNNKSQKTKNYVMLCLFAIVVATSSLILIRRRVLSQKKVIKKPEEL